MPPAPSCSRSCRRSKASARSMSAALRCPRCGSSSIPRRSSNTASASRMCGQHFQIYTNDQASRADEYRSLIVAYRNGAAVRLSDIADVRDSVENLRNFGEANGKPSVLVILSRTPGGNIIDIIDRVKAELPQLEASIPSDITVNIAQDRSTTIRTSLRDIEITLGIATILVIMVVFLFLRDAHASLIPTVAVPVSLLGTLGVMYLLGFSLDNLSLMAL